MKVIKKLYLESDVFPCNFKSNAITNISHSFFRNFQGYTPYSDIFARVKRITDLKGKEWYWCTFIIIFFNLYQNKIVFFLFEKHKSVTQEDFNLLLKNRNKFFFTEQSCTTFRRTNKNFASAFLIVMSY